MKGFANRHSRELQKILYDIIGEFAGAHVCRYERCALVFTVTKRNHIGQIKIIGAHWKSTFRSIEWIEVIDEDLNTVVSNLTSTIRHLEELEQPEEEIQKLTDLMSFYTKKQVIDYRLSEKTNGGGVLFE